MSKFNLAAYVRKSTKASSVPLRVRSSQVLGTVVRLLIR